MAVKYSCDKCGSLFETKGQMSFIRFTPPEGHNLYIHSFAGFERDLCVGPIDNMLCDKCASEFLTSYTGKPVDARKMVD